MLAGEARGEFERVVTAGVESVAHVSHELPGQRERDAEGAAAFTSAAGWSCGQCCAPAKNSGSTVSRSAYAMVLHLTRFRGRLTRPNLGAVCVQYQYECRVIHGHMALVITRLTNRDEVSQQSPDLILRGRTRHPMSVRVFDAPHAGI